MEKNLATARKLAVLTVSGSVGLTLLAAALLPPELRGVLPIFALTVPFLATAALDGAAPRGDQFSA
jgi:hypothetical protein